VISGTNVSKEPDLACRPQEHQTYMIGEEFFEFLAIISVLYVLMIVIR
jgi:hypothetical protein